MFSSKFPHAGTSAVYRRVSVYRWLFGARAPPWPLRAKMELRMTPMIPVQIPPIMLEHIQSEQDKAWLEQLPELVISCASARE